VISFVSGLARPPSKSKRDPQFKAQFEQRFRTAVQSRLQSLLTPDQRAAVEKAAAAANSGMPMSRLATQARRPKTSLAAGRTAVDGFMVESVSNRPQ